ncbi:MAG: hypothetical protein IJJ38_06095 [Lachnospiraceae bacterium]|nr:hypothetical protein [Lachnospiraceae bacterium]
MKKSLRRRLTSGLLILLILVMSALAPVTVQAASFKKSKPKITKTSAYLNKKVSLKWSKVKKAKKYEIQRAKINPSTGKTGKWKKWKTVKKNYIKTSATGDYKYRVRAVKGKTKSKWSAAKRVFAARAKITHMGYTEPDVFFGVTLHEGKLAFRVLVKNSTKSPMGFVESGSRFQDQNTVYAINKSTGKKVKSWEAYLDAGTGIAKMVNPGKSQSLYFYSFVTAEEWARYKNCKFMIASSFYPNPEVEDISTQMAISYTKNVSESSIAVK